MSIFQNLALNSIVIVMVDDRTQGFRETFVYLWQLINCSGMDVFKTVSASGMCFG